MSHNSHRKSFNENGPKPELTGPDKWHVTLDLQEKRKALSDLATLIAALSNQQCHFDLVDEDYLVLEIKKQELIDEFKLIQLANSN